MNLERLRWGEWIAGIAALDLLLVTFRAWYKVSGGNGKVSAWDALSSGRYLLLATAVVGVFLLVLVAAEQAEQLSFPPGALAALVGLGCTVYIAYRLATPPVDTLDADIGLYFGLASALGVAIGGLISAREAAAPAFAGRDDSSPPAATFTGPTGASEAPLGALVPDTAGSGTWSPAPATPAPNWTPAPPAPPATAAGAAFGTSAPTGERPLQVGDDVALTSGGARFPAGTIARIVEVFGGGALVEVTAADGVPERFEVPEEAFERLGAAGAPAAAGESWSPAMPAPAEGAGAPAGDDWGFDEEAVAADGAATTVDEPSSAEPAAEKVPFWKREIGGKKKREAAAEAGAAGALAAAPIAETADEAAQEERPGLFKRMFGGGKQAGDGAAEAATETLDEPVPEAEADETPSIVEEPSSAPEPEVVVDSEPEPEPEPEPAAPEPEVIVEPEPEPEPSEPEVIVEPEPEPPAPEPEVVTDSAPEPEPPAPEPEVVIDSAPEPEPEPEEKPKRKRSSGSRKVPKAAIADPEPPAPEPEVVPDPEPEAEVVAEPEVVPEPEPEVIPDPEPEAEVVAEPEVAPEPEPEVIPDPEPEVVSEPEVVPEPEPDPVAASEEEPAPKPRKRSSGSRKVPKEALAPAAGADVPPVVGDQVQLKVGGGKYDAGTRGVVVDVFSAGVIVELVADDGRTERLDLPFEAVGPAEA